MSALERHIEFARKHWQAPGGRPWEIETGEDGEEPDWLYSQYWLPLHSFRRWPVDKDALCESCRALAGTLTEDYHGTEPTRHPDHQTEHACRGLTSEPIQFVFLDLPRQFGKTVGTSGFVASQLFLAPQQSIKFMAGSEDQVTELFDEHYKAQIRDRPALAKRATLRGTKVTIHSGPGKGNRLSIVPNALSGATSGTQTLLIIDECRLVLPEVFAALIGEIFAQNGWRCPHGEKGHTRTKGDLDNSTHPTECKTCGSRLVPWVGRCLAMSSAGEIKEGKDWFRETVEDQLETPDPRAWVYSVRDGTVGKKVARSTVDTVTRIFGGISSLAAHIEIETENIPRHRGEDWLTKAERDAVIDNNLKNQMSSDRPCVAFLDTSISGHLTSFVVVADDTDPRTETAWSRLAVVRIDFWEPAKMQYGVIDERLIEEHLDKFVPCFPLVSLRVDTRVMPWAVRLVKKCRREKPWKGIVDGVFWRDAERNASWAELETHIRARTIRIPNHTRLRQELRGARRLRNAEGVSVIREASGKTKHLDVAESLAACAYLAHLQTLKRSVTLTQVSAASKVRSAMRGRGKRQLHKPREY